MVVADKLIEKTIETRVLGKVEHVMLLLKKRLNFLGIIIVVVYFAERESHYPLVSIAVLEGGKFVHVLILALRFIFGGRIRWA